MLTRIFEQFIHQPVSEGSAYKRWTTTLVRTIALCCLILSCSAVQATPIEDATAQVERFHLALMASARLDAGYDARAELLGEVLDKVFDVARISRISAGAVWRELDDPAKVGYTQLLRDLVVGTYVSRFDADRGQQLLVLEASEVKAGRHVVRAQIVRPNGDRVALDYYLRDNRVFNVVADGVSDLSVRRADYAAIISVDGFPALLEHLKTQLNSARAALPARSE